MGRIGRGKPKAKAARLRRKAGPKHFGEFKGRLNPITTVTAT